MTHRSKHCRAALAACVWLTAVVAAVPAGKAAEQPEQSQPAQANADLPQGAIRQLGSNRFRAGGQLGGVWLSRNGTRLTTLGSGLRIYDTGSGRLLRQVQPRFVMNPLAEKERQGVLAWSPDGSIVAIATREKQLLVLDGETLEPVWATDAHAEQTAGTKLVACSPDGRLVAAGTDTGSVLIFDVASGTMTRELSYSDSSPKMLWFRGTNNRLVSFWSDGTFREWDYLTGDLIQSGKRSPYWNYFPYTLDSRGAKLSLTGGGRLTYYQIDENNKELRRSFRADDSTLTVATISGNLDFLATASREGRVRLFKTEDFSQVAELAGITAEVNYLSLSVDASLLAVGHKFAGNRVRIYRRQQDDGGFRFVEQLPDDGHLAGITQLQFGANGKRLMSSSGPDNTSHLWDVRTGSHVAIEAAGRGSITSDGLGVAVSGVNSGNGVRLLDATDSSELKVTRTINARMPIALSPDGRFVAAAPLPRQQAIAVWDRSTGELQCELPLSNSTCYAIAWSPDSKRLAIAGADETVRVYEVPSGRRVHEFAAAARYVLSFAGSDHLLTMQYDGRRPVPVAVRDLQSGAVVRELKTDKRIMKLTANEDGLLVAGLGDGTVQIWNWKTGELRKELKGHAASVHAVAISPDGNTIASGSMDSLIYLWDVRTAATR